MADKNEPNRRRKWAPKARTGCRTCKTRHVKCDEARPVCRRCFLSGFRCDGYATNLNKRDEGSASPSSDSSPEDVKPATPEAQYTPSTAASSDTPVSSVETVVTAATSPSPSLSLTRLAPSEPLLDDDKYCLKLYTDLTANLVSRSNAAPHFWHTLVPQAAWSYPGVRHAISAAALSSDSLLRRAGPCQQTELRILTHASKAVNSLLTDKLPLDVILLTSATLGILDLFNGQWETAITHVTSGARLAPQARQEHGSDPFIAFYSEAFAAALPKVLTRYPQATQIPLSKLTRVRLQEAVASLELAVVDFDRLLTQLNQLQNHVIEQISRIIHFARYESQWLKARWDSLLRLELSRTSPPDDEVHAHLHCIESPWHAIISELDTYLAQGGLFDVAKFEIAMERTLPFFIFAKSGANLEMRQDATELLLVGNRIRGRPGLVLGDQHGYMRSHQDFDGS